MYYRIDRHTLSGVRFGIVAYSNLHEANSNRDALAAGYPDRRFVVVPVSAQEAREINDKFRFKRQSR
jgi:hypothetical protein